MAGSRSRNSIFKEKRNSSHPHAYNAPRHAKMRAEHSLLPNDTPAFSLMCFGLWVSASRVLHHTAPFQTAPSIRIPSSPVCSLPIHPQPIHPSLFPSSPSASHPSQSVPFHSIPIQSRPSPFRPSLSIPIPPFPVLSSPIHPHPIHPLQPPLTFCRCCEFASRVLLLCGHAAPRYLPLLMAEV